MVVSRTGDVFADANYTSPNQPIARSANKQQQFISGDGTRYLMWRM